jgi:hypothetical protein
LINVLNKQIDHGYDVLLKVNWMKRYTISSLYPYLVQEHWANRWFQGLWWWIMSFTKTDLSPHYAKPHIAERLNCLYFYQCSSKFCRFFNLNTKNKKDYFYLN